jgi:hypothetical protein
MSRLLKIAAAFALAVSLVAIPQISFAGIFIGISVNFGPPALPIYVQPPCPAPNLIWTPGYWAYGNYGYYWVPGTWVQAPQYGYYWTPGYWGYNNGYYGWNNGYWGPQVGYYGGINYGYGYGGNGYYGGRWSGNQFAYNTVYSNVNRTYIRNVYVNRTVNNYYGNRGGRVSYNGGPGGIQVRPNAMQLAYGRQRHIGLTSVQQTHIRIAASNRNYLATVNRGRPTNVAFARPLGTFHRPTNFVPLAARSRTTGAYHAPVRAGTTYHAPVHAATMYHAPVHAATTYHAPVHAATMYHAPVRSTYRAPVTTYHAPVHSYNTYHAPAATYYRAPATTYHAPVRPAGAYHGAAHVGGAGGHPPAHTGGGQPDHH